MEKLKNNTINKILIIFSFIFNILIFAPLEIYYTNKNELWFQIKDILPIIMLFSIGISIIITLISLALKKSKKNIFLKTLFSITLALYIQGNFLNFGYGVLDGSKIEWNLMIGTGFINVAIWLIIMILPYLFKKLKNEENFKIFSSAVSIFIILIEIITLVTVVINVPKEEEICINGLNNNSIFNVSKNTNIIVFMSDTFEGTYMNKILEEYPEYKEKLQDFTYFDNCTGVSFFTYSSMPTLLTGVECQVGNTLRQNIEYCFNNSKIYKVLNDNNYTTEVYTERSLQPNFEYVENLKKADLTTTFKTKVNITKKMYKYTMYRYLPHFLKSKFVLTSDEFSNIKNSDTALSYKEKTYFLDDVAFNKALVEGGITADNKKNCFKFYETNGMHIPYDTNTNLEYDNSEEYKKLTDEQKRYNEGIASLNLLCNYIDELKKQGVYENTTIIFLADHGYNNRFYTNLLVKKANDKHEFKISSAPVSLLTDLVPTILNIATNSKEYGKDFFDYNAGELRTRQVFDYTYETNIFKGNEYKVISRMIFQTEGLASDKNSFYVISEQYENDNKELSEKYEFGQTISISDIANSLCVNLTGVALDDVNLTIPKGTNISKNIYLTLNALKTERDIEAVFKIKSVYDFTQTINFKIDGETIYTCKVSNFGNKDISFEIPKEIWNSRDRVVLEMEFPDAKLGNYHATMMTAICLNSFSFNN